MAAEMLGQVPAGRDVSRELIFVSDFQRTNWTGVDFSICADMRVQLESVDAKSNSTLNNLAILRAVARVGPLKEPTCNSTWKSATSRRAMDSIDVDVTVGNSAYRLHGTCGAWERTTLSQPIAVNADGWLTGEARLVDLHDALAADNSRAFVVHVRPRPGVRSVEPPAQGIKLLSGSGALAPFAGRARATSAQIVRPDPGQTDAESSLAAELSCWIIPASFRPKRFAPWRACCAAAEDCSM